MSAEVFRRGLQVLALSAFSLLLPSKAFAELGPGDAAGAHTSGDHIVLEVGTQTVLPADGVRSYSEATRGIVDVRLTRDSKSFVLVGLKPGSTTLLFLMENGTQKLVQIEVTSGTAQEAGPRDNRVGLEHNVRLDFYFVQVDRAQSMQLGVRPPESFTMGTFGAEFDFLTQAFDSATAVVENQALLRLDIAQASGWAKLMRKAAVIAENGQPATFSGGGEVNIPVQGGLGTGIHRISFGSTVEVLPRYDVESGRLEITLAAEVADLTDDRGSGAPGRVTSTLQTVVNLELGQAVVLAGLTAESRQLTKSGVPGLSQIPILGALFGSRRSSHQTADTVILIVPSVVEATSPGDRRQIEQALRAYQEYKGRPKDREGVQRATQPVAAEATVDPSPPASAPGQEPGTPDVPSEAGGGR